MDILTKDGLLRRVLAAFFAAVLAVSMVPTPALAAGSADSANRTAEAQQQLNSASSQEDSSDDASSSGSNDAEESDSAHSNATESSNADSQESTSNQQSSTKESASTSNSGESDSISSSDATVQNSAAESVTKSSTEESSAEALERSVAEGKELLSAAFSSAPYDADNPYTKVEVGKYAPGTYTVTANLFIPASKNPFNKSIQAYMTNPENPLGIVEPDNGDPSAVTGGVPIFHVNKNATLIVGEDDSLTLTIPIRNPVFTLQGIGSGQGVELLSAHTRAGQYGPRGASGEILSVGHTSRVDSVTFKLSNSGKTTDGSDGYTIQGCSEYPTILDQNWHVDLDLTVDLSNVPASQKYVANPVVSQDLAYTGHEQQGVTFEIDKCEVTSGTAVATNAGDYSVALKPKAGFVWFDGTTDERTFDWTIAKAQVVKKYEVVVPCSEDVSETIAALPSADTVNANFTYEGLAEGDTPESLGISGQTFDSWWMGELEYAQTMPEMFHNLVPTALEGEFSGENVGTDNYEVSTQAIAHITLAPGQMPVAHDVVYNGASQLGVEQADGTPFTNVGDGKTRWTPWNDFTQTWFLNLAARSFIDVGTYSVTLSPSENWAYADGYWSDGTNEPKTLSWEIKPATLTAKARDIYIHEGEVATLKVDVSGFVAQENAGTIAGYEAPVATVENGNTSTLSVGDYPITVSGGNAKNYVFEYRSATLHVLPADTAAVPFVESNLTYTGKQQTGVSTGAGYTVEGGTSTDAGTYTATATLADGVSKWADGSTEKSRTFEWSIAKAELKATYINESVSHKDYESGKDAPAFRIKVTGFVHGESPEEGTVAGYVAPELYLYKGEVGATDLKASDWKADEDSADYAFIPAGGSAKNYEFSSYKWGTLDLIHDAEDNYRAAFPYIETPLTYTGKQQTGVYSRVGSTVITGASGVDVGTYKATVALDDERTGWWESNWYGENEKPTGETRIISAQWSIVKAPLAAKAQDVTITAGDAIPSFTAEVSGFKNGEASENAAGYKAPTVSLPAGVSANTLEAGKSYELSVSGGSADNYTFADYESGTLTVLPRGTVAEPTVAQGLTYTGSEQRAIQENEAWTLSGATATAAGDHETTVTLNAGYRWADGSTAPKTYHWSINKASLTATYAGEEITEGETPALKVDVTGFVNGETADTAAGYAAPIASLPEGVSVDTLESGKSYELSVSGGAADNYTFIYAAGTLTVKAADQPQPGKLAPGTYTVTANISMMTPLGFPGYTTNPFNPEGIGGKGGIPSAPVSNNATLIVGADGTYTLSLNLVNPVFTVQNAESSDGVTVEAVDRVPIEQKDDDEEYNKSVAADGVTSRIAHMTLKLNDVSGSYHFDNWKVYATTLHTFFPNSRYPQINSLDLSVDFDHAQKQVEGDYSKTFTDHATGVSVTVSAEKGADTISQLEKASLQVEKVEAGSEHDGAVQALMQLYASIPSFSFYKISLIADREAVSFDDKTAAEVSIPTTQTSADVYSFKKASLSAISSQTSSGVTTCKSSQLGSFVVVDSQGAAKFAWSHTVRNASTGASMTYSTDASVEDTLFESAYGPGHGLEALEWYGSYMDESGVSSSQAPDSFSEKALAAAKESGSNSLTVAGTYAMGISYSMDGTGVPNNLFDSLALGYTFTAGVNPLSAVVPVGNNDASVYAVYGTVGEGATGAKKLDAQIADGYAKVSLNDSDAQIPGLSSMLFHAAANVGDYTGAPQTAETQIAYLVAVEPSTHKIAKPTAAEGLIYNGQEQTGVPEAEGYDVTTPQASNAGTYQSVVTLKDGYLWSDGTKDALTINWSIAKAELNATAADETIRQGQTPAYQVNVTGFVNGETADTAAGYTVPVASLPEGVSVDTLESGKSYELSVSGGAADNYTFIYAAGTLTVKAADQPQPGKLAPGTYTVTANLAMPGQYNPVIKGLTVYANSPDNPFGPTIDENNPAEVHNTVPSNPQSANAKLVVGADGTKTLILPVKNPIFTTQDLGVCGDLSNVHTERITPTAGGGTYSGSYGNKTDRIHMMSAELPAGQSTGTATFNFSGSKLYAVPLDLELAPSGSIALQLTVDYNSLSKDSDSTELPSFAKSDAPKPNPDPTPTPDPSPTPNPGPTPGPTPNPDPTPVPDPQSDPGDLIETHNGHLAAGTYTVSANIWVNKATSGLPLQPHFTSAAFPPMNPVSKNATLRVEEDGHAYVTVPIVIQSRVMQVLSLSGLNIVSQSYSGEGLSSITVDLGILSGTDTITKNVTANIRLGTLAKTIIGGAENRTWACTFQVVFNGSPTSSGGGTVPKAVQAILDAQGSDGRNANADENAQNAADAALAALDAEEDLADESAITLAGNQSAKGQGKNATEQALDDVNQAIRNNPELVISLVALIVVVIGVVSYTLYRRGKLGGVGK
ncbi:MBG domain-containing protein [Cryptobacterium curtum]|uniref:MBG domain-containing protein n=1 Tax=Cryptobacterium curtum TaxID=84163 RepID=UPI00248E64FC|nr:MBG domain-containing protein [Cryptobacterium curtum]